jgi:hypothetical protein
LQRMIMRFMMREMGSDVHESFETHMYLRRAAF